MPSKKMNPWSMVAALCAVGICPLFSIAAIFAGSRALIEIKARDETRGARLAWASILVGATITGIWGGGMLWWNMNVRSMINQGPIQAIIYGQSGEMEEFLGYFIVQTAPEEAASFLQELHARYGVLQKGQLNPDIEESPVDSDKLFLGMVPEEAKLQYLLVFEGDKMVSLTADYKLFSDGGSGNQFTNRFTWFAIQDEKNGSLVYPADTEEFMHHD